MALKRCICGRSKAFPICDGAHASERWHCTAAAHTRAPWAFVAGPQNQNVAERLAAELGGVAVHTVDEPVRAERLVVLTEGYDLEHVERLAARVEATERRALVLGTLDAGVSRALDGAVASALPGWTVHPLVPSGLELWPAILAAVTGSGGDAPASLARPLMPAFVSHAVADEPSLLGPVAHLRRAYAADLFMCADSIALGSVWHETIAAELRARARFVLVLSGAAATSTFCAFEVGYALALERLPVLIALDGARPPAYVQHLQLIDLERRRGARPWLSAADALVEAMLEALT